MTVSELGKRSKNFVCKKKLISAATPYDCERTKRQEMGPVTCISKSKLLQQVTSLGSVIVNNFKKWQLSIIAR